MITGQEFEVNRRVYVDFEGISLRRKFLTGLEPELINVMIGNAIIIIFIFLFDQKLLDFKLIFFFHADTIQVPYRLKGWAF